MNKISADDFFALMDKQRLGLTFDDVTVLSDYSEVPLDRVSLKTRFSRNIPLTIPLVSAAMDTVTEHEMAIALALAGGIGVIHCNMSPEEQAKQVDRVKFHLNGLINEPKCIRDASWTIEQVLRWREEKKYRFHSFPVIDGDGKIVGLLTNSDFLFCEDHSRQVSAVMTRTRKLITAPVGTTKQKALAIMRQHKKSVLPLVTRDGRLGGMFTFSDLARIAEGHASHNTDVKDQLRVAAAIGTDASALARAKLLIEKRVDALVIDTSHADRKRVFEIIAKLKSLRAEAEVDIVAGNISGDESARRLIEAGVDGIKVGQGVGSICTTSLVTGVGRAQLTAVHQTAKTARWLAERDGTNIPICADGGIRQGGDILKALAAGAESVTVGNLLSCTTEAPGRIVKVGGVWMKEYRGMGSAGAMQGYADRYMQRGTASRLSPVSEGVTTYKPLKGPVVKEIETHIGGLRRGMSSVGAADIRELQQKAVFERITPAGAAEARPHDIEVTQEMANVAADE